MNFAVGEAVKINVPWASKEYPNNEGHIIAMRFGTVAVIATPLGERTLHVSYLEKVK